MTRIINPSDSYTYSSGGFLYTPLASKDYLILSSGLGSIFIEGNVYIHGTVSASSGLGGTLPTTTTGDLIAFSGTQNIRIPIGSPNQVLQVDSTAPGSIKWADVAGASPPNITGSTYFFTINKLDAQGTLTNTSGSLILSSSKTSKIYVSGVLDLLDFTNFDSRYAVISTTDTRYILTSSLPDQRYVLTSSYGTTYAIFSASINTLSQSLNGFTSSFTSSVQSIADVRYVSTSSYGTTFSAFSATINNFTQSVNGFTSSFSGSVQSIGSTTYGPFTSSINTLSQSLNGFTSSFSASVRSIIATDYGPFTASINTLSQSTNTFTASFNLLSQSLNGFTSSFSASVRSIISSDYRSFTSSINGFTASFTSSVQSIGDVRWVTTASYGTTFAAFSATINSFTQSVNGFTASFTSSVQSIGSTTYGPFTSSINTLSQSLNSFSASINIFSQSVNGFTASFSGSVRSIGDARYFFTSSLLSMVGSGTFSGTFSGSVDISGGKITGITALAIGVGGTGQTTKAASFDALSPTTTNGDLIVFSGATNIRVGVGTNTQVLTADSTAVGGVKWAAATAAASTPSIARTFMLMGG